MTSTPPAPQSWPPWLRSRLVDVFGTLDDPAWMALQASAQIVNLPAGDTLFEAGAPADHWYMVLSGRLSVTGPGATGAKEQQLAEVGAGEVLGELAVLTGRPRSATVRALRDSSLLRIHAGLLQSHLLSTPERASAMLRHLALRMVDRTLAPQRQRVAALCITLLPAHPGLDARAFAHALGAALSSAGSSAICSAHDEWVRILTQTGSDAHQGLTWQSVDAELDRRASDVDHLLLLADPQSSEWTRLALQRADRIVVVAHAEAPPQPLPQEQDWLTRRRSLAAVPPATLALLHPEGRTQPRGTAAWLDARPGVDHRHLTLGSQPDIERLARHLTGRTVALALSGGGARGFAHLGVVEAMRELALPIDGLAGTSAGSMCAALIAQQLPVPALRDAARHLHEARPFRRGTLPLYSLRSQGPFDAVLREALGDLRLEDLWLPLVVVSANLTRSQPHWHQRGSLFDAVRASSSLPGILPPHLMQGELLVDGGLVDNLPVDVARACIGPRVLAVDVAEDTVPRFNADQYPSPWLQLAPMRSRRRHPRPPGLLSILMHSMLLGSLAQTRRQRETADICLRPPLQNYGMMDTKHWAEIIDCGYRHALEVLTPMQSQWR